MTLVVFNFREEYWILGKINKVLKEYWNRWLHSSVSVHIGQKREDRTTSDERNDEKSLKFEYILARACIDSLQTNHQPQMQWLINGVVAFDECQHLFIMQFLVWFDYVTVCWVDINLVIRFALRHDFCASQNAKVADVVCIMHL